MSHVVALGRFGSPYGIKGWIKVISYTDPPTNILNYLPWIIYKGDARITFDQVTGKMQGRRLAVALPSCQDRNVAQTYTNLEIFIKREQLPEPLEDEYYWIDLIGLTVINCENVCLGEVEQLFGTGANDVIVAKEKNGMRRYIPYIQGVILEVDLKSKRLMVDWDPTF